MRVTIERADLLRSLTHVQSVVERRNTIPILSNLLIKADGSGVQLSATDLDIEVVETSSAEVAQPGATTAPAHMMYDIVRKLPDGSLVTLTDDGASGRPRPRGRDHADGPDLPGRRDRPIGHREPGPAGGRSPAASRQTCGPSNNRARSPLRPLHVNHHKKRQQLRNLRL